MKEMKIETKMTTEKELDEKADELRSRIYELQKQLEPVKKELETLSDKKEEVHKQDVLKNAGLTEDQVEKIAGKLSRGKEIGVFYNNKIGENSECEDDGFIHVTRNGIRFCKEGHESQLSGFARNVERLMKPN